MSEQENIDVVKKGYEAFGRGDIPGLLMQLDANVSWVTPGPAELPTAGDRRGHQGVAEFFQQLAAVVDITRFETREFIAQGDRVVVLGEGTETVKATGKAVEFHFAHVFGVRDGKVVSFVDYVDVSAVVNELRGVRAQM
jgi:ketosteroid isomerase-like protein